MNNGRPFALGFLEPQRLRLPVAAASRHCRCRRRWFGCLFFSWGLTCLAAWVKNEFDANAVGRNSPSGPKQPLITNLHTGPKQPLSPTGLGKISATVRADLTSRRGGMSHQLIPRPRGQPKRPKQPNVYSFLFRFLAAVASSSPSLDDLARSLSRFCCRKP